MMLRDFTSLHGEIRLLLPWYANGSLKGQELEQVRRHLRVCPICRDDLAACEQLATRIPAAPDPIASPEAGLARLRQRIEQEQAVTRQPRRRFAPASWMGLALAAGVVLALALPMLKPMPDANAYRTLANTDPAPAIGYSDLRVVFTDQVPEAQIREWLLAVDGHIVAGPNPVGAYIVRIAAHEDDRLRLAIEQLRHEPGVVLVEPMSTEAAAALARPTRP